MTRVAIESGAVNLSQGFPNEPPPREMACAAAGALLCGASAAAGQALHNAVKLSVKHYNEGTHPLNSTPCLHVGGKKYKLTDAVYDNRYTAEGGIAAAKRLVFEDGAKFVVGTMGSGPSVAASDAVFEANKIIFLYTGNKCFRCWIGWYC